MIIFITNRLSKTLLCKAALEAYMEDLEDMANAVIEHVRAGKEKVYSLEDVERELGLDNSFR